MIVEGLPALWLRHLYRQHSGIEAPSLFVAVFPVAVDVSALAVGARDVGTEALLADLRARGHALARVRPGREGPEDFELSVLGESQYLLEDFPAGKGQRHLQRHPQGS